MLAAQKRTACSPLCPARPPSCPQLRTSQPGSKTALQGRSQRSKAAASPPAVDAVVVDLDAVVQGLEAASTAWAHAAATATAQGNPIAGSPAVYERSMQQLLPVLQAPHEAALMLRLLHDEGVVGARSTAGREGPVVGVPLRQSGSRPLLLTEILEHWTDEIKPACLLRWSRQAGCSCSRFEQAVREAYLQAQQTLPWRVLDTQQRQHGSSSAQAHHVPAASSQAAVSSSKTGGSSSRGGSRGGSSPFPKRSIATAATTTAASVAEEVPAVLAGSTQPILPQAGGAVSITVQPYVSVVPCLQHCSAQVFVASSYPPALTQAVLSAVQLPAVASQQQQQQQVRVLYGSSMQQCLEQLQSQNEATNMNSSSSSSSLTARVGGTDNPSAGSSPGPPQVLVVLSSPIKAPGPSRESLPPTATNQQQQQQSQTDSEQQQQQRQRRESFLIAEWACRAPSLRARALSGQGLGLLSEWGLAELLGVDSSDAVMDGIAWR